MPVKIIFGNYHVIGREPDGDSIAFEADNAEHWNLFDWKTPSKKPTPQKNKPVQLRIEGIDSLETHYEGFHQPKAIAKATTFELLSAFGIDVQSYNLNFTKIVSASAGAPGVIASSGLDGYDRPIAYAILGQGHGLADGQELPGLTEELVTQTINYELAAKGQVYPTFYYTTDPAGVSMISKAVADAMDKKRGIWTFDGSRGFDFWEPRTLFDDVVVLPKLFRRLVNFCDASDTMEALADWAARKSDEFTVIETGQKFRKFGDLIEVRGQEVGLKFDPLEIMFKPS
jgi:hypothetical protein